MLFRSEIAALAARTEAAAVGVSVSASSSAKARSGIATLRSELSKKIELVAGGAGAPDSVRGVTIFSNLRDLDAWGENLLRTRPRRSS